MPTIRVDDEVIKALSERIKRPFKDTPNDVIRRLLKLEERATEDGPGGRRARGNFLPMSNYRRAILNALARRPEGKANVPTVMAHVGKTLAGLLTPDDKKRIKSGTVRWENRVLWERFNMVKEGLLKSDSPRGEWEITAQGHAYLEQGPADDELAEPRRERQKGIGKEARRTYMSQDSEEPSED